MKQKLDRCFFAVTVLMAWIACIETVLTAFRGQAAAKKLSGAFIQGSDEFVHGADCLGWRAACGADAGT